jgi:hypothetical protein
VVDRQEEIRTLQVDLLDLWHVGCGRGNGATLDAVMDRDAEGLPHVPGRMLRGLLRDAVECLCAWGHVPPETVLALFGGEARLDAQDRSVSRAGALCVSDARLDEAHRAWFAATAAEAATGDAREALFLTRFHTAVDERTGTVLPHSLRAVEVSVPMPLQAQVSLQGEALPAAQAWQVLDMALPLLQGVGANKTRGDGRARCTWVAREGQR